MFSSFCGKCRCYLCFIKSLRWIIKLCREKRLNKNTQNIVNKCFDSNKFLILVRSQMINRTSSGVFLHRLESRYGRLVQFSRTLYIFVGRSSLVVLEGMTLLRIERGNILSHGKNSFFSKEPADTLLEELRCNIGLVQRVSEFQPNLNVSLCVAITL